LALTKLAKGDALQSAVVSFGEKFVVHTETPTSDVEEVRTALSSIAVDPSGEENPYRAVGAAVEAFRTAAIKGRRKMVLVLATDESGDLEEAYSVLERAIEVARRANCAIYVLGPEAAFGNPHAWLRWSSPGDRRVHHLRLNRGPETAFPELLLTDGFGPRSNFIGSGFGPYPLVRMARETGGIYFLMPTNEQLVSAAETEYEIEVLRKYQPDLRSPQEVVVAKDRSQFRKTILDAVRALDPNNPEALRFVRIRQS